MAKPASMMHFLLRAQGQSLVAIGRHPLEAWATCCTNRTVHVPPTSERVAALMDYNIFRSSGGDVASAKAAAQHYLDQRPYLMTRPMTKW